jgi:hypothetical protein
MSSHLVILGEPYVTMARMEMKVLDNSSAYALGPVLSGARKP